MAFYSTVVHALQDRATELRDRPALWTWRGDAYLPTSWRQYAGRVRAATLGWIQLGLSPGDRVMLRCSNREEWHLASLAVLAAGGVGVGVAVDAPPEQVAAVARHCGAAFAFVEGPAEQEGLARVPRHVSVTETVGATPWAELGTRLRGASEGPYHDRVAGLDAADLASLVYPLDQPGPLRGVMLSHRNLVWAARSPERVVSLHDREVVLSAWPLSRLSGQATSLYGPVLQGVQVYFPRPRQPLDEALRQVQPTLVYAPPPVWERVQVKLERVIDELPAPRSRLIAWARRVMSIHHTRQLQSERISAREAARFTFAQQVLLTPLKQALGLARARLLATSGAPIGQGTLEFLASVDLLLREAYGLAESGFATCANTESATRLGTQGRPLLGVEARIAADGELLVRGEGVCLGYLDDPARTKSLLAGGWLHTGDVGELDSEGYFRLRGRKSEQLRGADGRTFSTARLEARLRAIRPLGHALVFGTPGALRALLTLDPDRVPAFARRYRYPADPQVLARHEPFLAHLRRRLDEEGTRGEPIVQFDVVPNGFSVEGGELTPARELVRATCLRKHARALPGLDDAPPA